MLNDEGSAIDHMEDIVEKEKVELETKEIDEDNFVHYESERPKVITFTKAMPQEYEEPSMRKFDVDKYGRRVLTDAKIEIHGYTFVMDLVVDEYEGTTKPSVVFRRDFLLDAKCTMSFGLCEMQNNIRELQDDKDVDWLLENMLNECAKKGNSTWEIIKMGKASHLKNKNQSLKEFVPPPSPTSPLKEEISSFDLPPPPKETLPPLSQIKEAKAVEKYHY
ncbi:hypothetical protein Tco_0628434 [Tanacetum coccineum]|uniref:Uncharacterized protein n=1 Tax=Tanacetum coccineum TaxID=301880 RepID=A0ABQ4WQC4_9ASTR